MTQILPSDRAYCENLVYGPGRTFSVSHRFSRPEIRDKLLILRALSEELRAIPVEVSEPGVASLKLAWWRQELELSSALHSQHPVIRSLIRSDIHGDMDQAMLGELFSALLQLSSGEAIQSLEQLFELSKKVGGSETLLAACPNWSSKQRNALGSIGSASFLGRYLHNFDTLLCGENWWLPLDIQARFGLTLDGLGAHKPKEKTVAVIRYLCGVALEALCAGQQQLKNFDLGPDGDAELHHVMIGAALTDKRLRNLAARPVVKGQARTGRLTDVIIAWWKAIRA